MINYGILQEKSDLRAHVSVIGKSIYIYPTQQAIAQINKYHYPKGTAYTAALATGVGYLVPPYDIKGIRVVDIPDDIFNSVQFDVRDTTTQKGNKAVSVVRQMLSMGLFPLDSVSEIVDNKDLQIDGYDITVKLHFHIQVKCDWKCGVSDGCTGNLFIQISERNIFKQH